MYNKERERVSKSPSLASQILTRGEEKVGSTAIYRSVPNMFADMTPNYDVEGPAGPANENKHYTSIFGHHVCKQ